jgi:hypothetical protein
LITGTVHIYGRIWVRIKLNSWLNVDTQQWKAYFAEQVKSKRLPLLCSVRAAAAAPRLLAQLSAAAAHKLPALLPRPR